MRMTVTVELSDHEVALIGQWASLGRTFDNVERCLCINSNSTEDERSIAVEEILLLHKPVERLFHSVRDEIWKVTGPIIESILADYKAGTVDAKSSYAKLKEFGWSRFKAREYGIKFE